MSTLLYLNLVSTTQNHIFDYLLKYSLCYESLYILVQIELDTLIFNWLASND